MHSNYFGPERILCIQHRVSLPKNSLSEVSFIFGFGAVCLSIAGQYILHKGTTKRTSAEKKRKEKKWNKNMRRYKRQDMKTMTDEKK